MSDGKRGIFQTLKIMRKIVHDYRKNPAIRQAATSLIFLQPEKSPVDEARVLFEYVRDSIRYTRDIVDVETITTPDKTLLLKYGDCDDQVILLASLMESAGYPTRFVVTAYTAPDMLEHVYLQVCLDGVWVDCDPTEHEEFGYAPPDPLTIYIEGL